MKFPNGFDSWYETHHEVVEFITVHEIERQSKENSTEGTEIAKRQEAQGIGGLYELAKEWTDEFEKKNKGRKWDGEFFDEIDIFLNKKNNSNG